MSITVASLPIFHNLSGDPGERRLHRLLRGLLEPPLLQLHLLHKFTPLYIGQQERLHQIPNNRLIIIKPPLESLQWHIHLSLPQSRHDTRLPRRGLINCIVDYPVEVGVHCALVHPSDLVVEVLLALTDYTLGVALTGLVDLAVATVVLGGLDQLGDLVLLLGS